MRFLHRITLRTPESVELEFTLAGIGNRALALLADYLVMGIILIVFLFAWGLISYELTDAIEKLAGDSDKVGLWLLAIQVLITFAIYVGYFAFFEALWRGQTPGKRYAKIRVIRDDGRPIGLAQATLRALLRPIDDNFLFIGFLLIVLTRREKRLGDWVAGTLVVQEERPIAPASFVINESTHALVEQLLQISDISRLLPDDFAVIREYLQRRKDLVPKARTELSLQLARQTKDIIALEKVPQGTTSDSFLEAVYLAYQRQFL